MELDLAHFWASTSHAVTEGQCLRIGHITNMRHTDWSESACCTHRNTNCLVNHFDLFAWRFLRNWVILGRMSRQGHSEHRVLQKCSHRCCSGGGEAFRRIQTGEHTQNLTHELHGGCPCLWSEHNMQREMRTSVGAGYVIGGLMPSLPHALAVRDSSSLD